MVHTVRKVAAILDLFSTEKSEWGVSEVARQLKIPKSTAHALMDSLAEQHLLQRTDQGRYQLGWRLFELGQTLLDATQIRVAARAVMQGLVDRVGETVHLATLDGLQAVFIERLPRIPEGRGIAARKGDRRPAYRSGVGKVLLAYKLWEDLLPLLRDEDLHAVTPNTITDLEMLHEELQETRRRGYGYDVGETDQRIRCIAAPIFNDRGKVIAAISLVVPPDRFKSHMDSYHDAVVEAAGRISRSANRDVMGGHGLALDRQQI